MVESAADRRREWDEDGLAAFAEDAQDAVAVFFAEVGDVQAGGFEDPQTEQSEQADQREVVPVGRLPGGGQQRLQLQVGQPEGRRLGRHAGAADVLGRGVLHSAAPEG